MELEYSDGKVSLRIRGCHFGKRTRAQGLVGRVRIAGLSRWGADASLSCLSDRWRGGRRRAAELRGGPRRDSPKPAPKVPPPQPQEFPAFPPFLKILFRGASGKMGDAWNSPPPPRGILSGAKGAVVELHRRECEHVTAGMGRWRRRRAAPRHTWPHRTTLWPLVGGIKSKQPPVGVPVREV